MVLELGGGLFGQRDVRETPAATSSSSSSSTIIAPIGTILPWLKSYTNTPQALPTGWMEADGSAISDADSVYDGQNAPDLNGGEFIRGAATSGGTGGGTTGAGSAHTHTQNGSVSNHTLSEAEMPSHTHDPLTNTYFVVLSSGGGSNQIGSGSDQMNLRANTDSTGGDSGHDHNDNFSNANESAHTHSSAPKYYDVVWIFRFK